MRIHFRAVLVACAAMGTLAVAGAPAWAQGDGGFGAAPAHSNPADPATRAYFKPVIKPGASFSDEIEVMSTSNAPIRLIVSAVDGLTGQTSGAVYANRQDRVRKAGAWVKPAVSSLTLAPHSQQLVGFTVHVPATAVPGDHLAGIAFENADPSNSGGQFGVTEVIRTVVGVDIIVAGTATGHVRLSGLGLAALPGLKYATVTIHIGDDGRKLVKPIVTVSLTGPSGYHRTLHRALDTILPGDTIAYPYVWPDNLRAGNYLVTVTATNGAQHEVETATVHLGAALQGTTKRAGFVVTTAKNPLGSAATVVLVGSLMLAMALFVGFRLGARREPNLAR